jgi:hypothetical protein
MKQICEQPASRFALKSLSLPAAAARSPPGGFAHSIGRAKKPVFAGGFGALCAGMTRHKANFR